MLRRRRIPSASSEPTFPAGTPVVQACHSHWRGVRESAYAFGAPVVEAADFTTMAAAVAQAARHAGVSRLVIQGWPTGAGVLARALRSAGIAVGAVSHASLAQHGTDAGESERVEEVLQLTAAGVIDRIGFVKPGIADVFRALGFPAWDLLNRVPNLPAVVPAVLGPGRHAGVILDPYWRKNVATQVAASILLGARAHVMRPPAVGWFPDGTMVAHGELPRPEFLAVLAAVDVNLHVTLSECHPMTPMESYLLGVPCLISRTSILFEDDPTLLSLTSVNEIDNPTRIAAAAENLLAHRDEAVRRARVSLTDLDRRAATAWEAFIS